jgi:hypothetical protein
VEFVVATVLFPLLLAVLALGGGLLVDRIVGQAVPGVLLAVVGLAALVVVAELCSQWEATAALAPYAFVAVGAGGLIAGRRRLLAARPDWWLVGATAAVYAMVCAPVLLHGQVTLAGYLLDTTVAFHLAGSDYLLEHARDFARLPESSFRSTMENYFGIRYPGGGQTLLGGGGRLVGTPAIWLYQPLLSLLVAFCAAPLYYMARTAALARPLAALTALVASAPALVYAYAQMGAIKELAVLPFVLLLGPLLILLPRWLERGWRGALVPAVVGAAGVGAIGLAFAPWLGLTLLAGGLLLVWGPERRRFDARTIGAWGAAFALGLVLLALPTFGALGDSLGLARSLSTSNALAVADPGNLLRPLLRVQIAGVWIGGSHRGDPAHRDLTFVLIGVMFAAAALGAAYLVRRRSWSLAGFVAVMAIAWVALTLRGTAWTDAKLLVISSPIVVLLAAVGLESLRRSGRRVEALALAVPLVVGVLWSNASAYHETNLAPTERLEELLSIGERRGGEGPTLLPEFDEFALYALANMAPAGPGFSFKPASLGALVDGSGTGYGRSYDLDSLDPAAVQGYSTIVARRRPDSSRPPSNFRLVERGDYYDVWRRRDGARVIAHVGAGAGLQPAGQLSCRRLAALARRARAEGASLLYVSRARLPAIAARGIDRRPLAWGDAAEDAIGLGSPGVARKRFRIAEAGAYDVWLKGDFARALSVTIDGRRIGSVAEQSGNEGNYALPLRAELSAGPHLLELERGGGSLRPGDGAATILRAIVFEPDRAGSADNPVRELAPSDWRRLCGRPLDWVEIARPKRS